MDIDVNVNVDNNVDGQIVLTWTLKRDLKDRVAKFIVYREDSSSGSFQNSVQEILQADGKLDEDKGIYTYTFTDTNVIVGGKYEVPFFYKVTAVDKEGHEGKPSAVTEAKTSDFNAPAAVKDITVLGSNSFNDIKGVAEPRVVIEWTPNTENDIVGYHILRIDRNDTIPNDASQALNEAVIAHKTGSKMSWINVLKDEDVGKPFWYVVVAVDYGNRLSSRPAGQRYRASTLKTPQLVSPSDKTTAAKPVFKWDAVNDASAYVVVLQSDTRGKEAWRSPVINQGTTEVTLPDSITLTSGLTYYWFVIAYATKPNSNKEEGNSTSQLWSFDAANDD